MAAELRMPSLGADMEDGVLVEWHIVPGQAVHRGDVIAAIETSKGIIDIEAFDEGVIERLVVEPGTRVLVGAPLAMFRAASGDAVAQPGSPAPAPAAPPPLAAPSVPAPAVAVAPGASLPERRAISPAARARAGVLGVDLAAVRGTAADGAITLRDVEQAAAGHASPPVSGATTSAATAAAMARSKREIPHYYLQLAMDFTPALQWLEAHNREQPVTARLLPAALLLRAVALAAARHAGFNGHYGSRGFEPAAAVHVGTAIALRGAGLVAPAILNANEKPLAVVMRELQDLVARARAGHLRGSELAAPTITLTSLGEEGVDVLLPVINPPQVAIIGAGSVSERPWVIAGRIEVRKVIELSLAADHRVTDGRRGARLLADIRDLLTRPELL